MARTRNTTDKTASKKLDEAAEIDALEAALNGDGDLDIDIDIDGEVEEEANAAREAAYEGSSSTIDVADEDEVAAARGKASKGGGAVAGTPEKPDAIVKGSRGTSVSASTAGNVQSAEGFLETMLASFDGALVLSADDEEAMDAEALTAFCATITQKKVREKVVNLLKALLSDGKVSVYTQHAMKLVVDAYSNDCATVTLAQIKQHLMDNGSSTGTAASQAGQMMSMLPALGIVTKPQNGSLVPNPKSLLLDAYMAK